MNFKEKIKKKKTLLAKNCLDMDENHRCRLKVAMRHICSHRERPCLAIKKATRYAKVLRPLKFFLTCALHALAKFTLTIN